MRKLLAVLALVVPLFPQCGFAQSEPQPVPVSFTFLRTIVGARPAALAGSMLSVSRDPHAIFYNPAGIADMTTKAGVFGYLNHILDIQSFVGAYVHTHRHGSYGAGVHYTDYGSFRRTDKFGEDHGDFAASSMTLYATYSRIHAERWLFGASAKYFRSEIDQYTADGFGLDFGVIYHSTLFDNLNIAAGVFNIGTARTAYINTKELVPLNFQFGVSKRLAHLPFTYSAVLLRYRGRGEDFRIRLGGEFEISKKFFMRLGYDTVGKDQKLDTGSTGDRFAGLSLGFGLSYNEYVFDYAFSSFGEVGSLNRLSLSVMF